MKRLIRVLGAIICISCLSNCGLRMARYQEKWDPRVGVFTYEQVVSELGLPEAKEKLPNGGFRAQWRKSRTYIAPVTSRPVQSYNYQTGTYSTTYVTGGGGGGSINERMLLRFDKGEVLREWSYSRD